jgi:hypothetical protein
MSVGSIMSLEGPIFLIMIGGIWMVPNILWMLTMQEMLVLATFLVRT